MCMMKDSRTVVHVPFQSMSIGSEDLWRGGLMATDFGSSDRSPGRGHCAVFLGETLYSNSASLHPGV